jgi:integrase
VRAVYRRALSRGDLTVNPTTGLELPAVRGKRDRVASPGEAARLLDVLTDERDCAAWATAFYAGLRRGELLALRWEDIELATGVLRVERAFDPVARQYVPPKSRAGRRTVPISAALREPLAALRLRSGRSSGLAFGDDAQTTFDALRLTRRTHRVWNAARLEPVGLHEARQTYASLMIAAGVNAKALSTYMGHANVSTRSTGTGTCSPAMRTKRQDCSTPTSCVIHGGATHCLGHGCTEWAWQSALALADDVCTRVGIRPNYLRLREDDWVGWGASPSNV